VQFKDTAETSHPDDILDIGGQRRAPDGADELAGQEDLLNAGEALIVNGDDDDDDGVRDWEDMYLNGADDALDLAPILVRLPSLHGKGWTATLSLDGASVGHARLFRFDGGDAVPQKGNGTIEIPFLSDTVAFGVEAFHFPGQEGFDGYIELTAEVRDELGQIVEQDSAQMRVAPLILTSSLNPPKRVLAVFDSVEQAGFLEQLSVLLGPQGTAVQWVGQLSDLPLPVPLADDLWLQDAVEIGFTTLPAAPEPHVLFFALEAPRGKPLDLAAREALLGPDMGWVECAVPFENPPAQHGFANLELSPVLLADEMYVPYGRLYAGFDPFGSAQEALHPEVAAFLESQQMQGPIVQVDTGWLSSGMVDEMIAWIPWNGGPGCCGKGFVMLKPSPQAGLDLLEELSTAGHGAALLLEGTANEVAVDDLLSDIDFVAFNQGLQVRIDAAMETPITAFGLIEEDMVSLPVLFKPAAQEGLPGNDKAVALLPSPINSLVLGKLAIVPDPHGPMVDGEDQFAAAVITAVEPYSEVVELIDDWAAFEAVGAGVHRATQIVRLPFNIEWWYL